MAPRKHNLPFFLSYSRKDYDLVMSIKAEIESLTGKLCWMDTEGIESGNPAFDNAIVKGINECRVFLFMLSENSQKSEFAINELEFARKKARDEGKKVVMVNIDGCSLSDTFFLRYSRVDTIYWQDPIQKRKLFANLKTWLLEDGSSDIFISDGNSSPIQHLFFLIDTSGSMYGDRMDALNEACKNTIASIDVIRPDIEMRVGVLYFSSDARWMTSVPQRLEDFRWAPLEPDGMTNLGAACAELDTKMSNEAFFGERLCGRRRIMKSLIILITDGAPSDNYKESLGALQQNPFFSGANRFAIGIGEDYDEECLREFTGKPGLCHSLPDVSASSLQLLLFRLITMGLYAGSFAYLEGDDENSYHLSPKVAGRTCAIGDVLTFGDQSGVVFYLDSSREHGKIVSTDSAVKKWCSTKEYLRHRDTGAISDDNGMDNLRQIQQIPDWEESYPAFKWCAKKGDGWYLPTIEELRLMAKRRNVIAEKIGGIDEQKWYWSSEQESVYSARYYHFLSGQDGCQVGKDMECMVLAVREF